jgi:hypothetical protein
MLRGGDRDRITGNGDISGRGDRLADRVDPIGQNKMSDSYLEKRLAKLIAAAPEIPAPVQEFRAIPARRYRWDFAWPEHRLLLEVNGGAWMKSSYSHKSGPQIVRDYTKNNLAVAAGWKILYCESSMISKKKIIEYLADYFQAEAADQVAAKPVDKINKGVAGIQHRCSCMTDDDLEEMEAELEDSRDG